MNEKDSQLFEDLIAESAAAFRLSKRLMRAAQDIKERATPIAGGSGEPFAVQRGSHEIDLSDDHADRASAAASNKSQPETARPIRKCNSCESSNCVRRCNGMSCLFGYPA